MRYVLKLLVCMLMIVSTSASAQTTELVEPKYKLTPRTPPDPASVHSSYANAVDIVSWWVNLWSEKAIRKQINVAINAQINKLDEVLKWTGGGALLNLRVISKANPDSPLRALGVLDEPANIMGFGTKPEDVWIDYWSTSHLVEDIPQGWTVDQVMSSYIWVTRDRNGKLLRKGVPRGTMLDLDRRVKDDWPVMLSRRLEQKMDNFQTWKRIADTAKQRIQSAIARKAIDDSLKVVAESQKRVAEMNDRLKKALDDDRKASEGVALISAIKGVLAVGEFAKAASEILGVNPDHFQGATTAEAIVQKAEEIREERHQYSVRIRADFDGSYSDLSKFLFMLWKDIQPAKPPEIIQRDFELPNSIPLP